MKLDHVVYFTKKAPLEVVWEQKQMGWHTVLGGSHEQWGTYNALMYVNNAYIEWLALEHKEIADHSSNPLVQLYLYDRNDGEGWGTICLSVDEIEQVNNQLMKAGYETSGVLNAERRTISGEVRQWKMLFIDQEPSDALPYPFFIEWEMEESERLAMLRQKGALLKDNEQLEITNCLFTVRNSAETLKIWETILDVKNTEDAVIELPNCRLEFRELASLHRKERLIDVSIEYRE